MHGKELRKKLKSGNRVYGTHIAETGNPNQLIWLTDSGMDFAFICTEHIPVDRKEVSWMCALFAERGVSPMVRIPYPSAEWAAMMLDGGAEGIVAPYVEKPEDVEALIGAVRYRPIKGEFLRQIISEGWRPSDKLKAFWERFNRNTYLIIGIESVPAIANLEKLIGYDEVDAVFLGPHDITCSMEIPEEYDNPDFVNTIKDVVKRCRKMGKGVGLHCDYAEPLNMQYIDEGMNFILHYSDVMKSRNLLMKEFGELKQRFGDSDDGLPRPDRFI
ncbi:MAG: HpcH/HpaI aldolase family protein [Spirochaetia bacterium]